MWANSCVERIHAWSGGYLGNGVGKLRGSGDAGYVAMVSNKVAELP